jgi:hypothetical protein
MKETPGSTTLKRAKHRIKYGANLKKRKHTQEGTKGYHSKIEGGHSSGCEVVVAEVGNAMEHKSASRALQPTKRCRTQKLRKSRM